jgi:putative membrane protein
MQRSIFQNFTLQISFKLDAANCNNISAPGATIAYVGQDKQPTFTVLPSYEKTESVHADVSDFIKEGIAINGIKACE